MFSHVVENEEGVITDFISYYSLPSTVLKSEKYDKINACFSYYNVATSVDMTELMRNAVILAQADGFDVYNCLNIMDNQEVFEELKFGRGSGSLHYYFFNYAFGNTPANKVGLTLV
jgi:glycylpeptide N-tetradecanoyltransferase